MIKQKNIVSDEFSFEKVTYNDILEKVNSLDDKKSSQQTDIPTNILKVNSTFFAEYFHKNINHSIENSIFPQSLKMADVVPVHKKKI